jgi:hypothetical protein
VGVLSCGWSVITSHAQKCLVRSSGEAHDGIAMKVGTALGARMQLRSKMSFKASIALVWSSCLWPTGRKSFRSLRSCSIGSSGSATIGLAPPGFGAFGPAVVVRQSEIFEFHSQKPETEAVGPARLRRQFETDWRRCRDVRPGGGKGSEPRGWGRAPATDLQITISCFRPLCRHPRKPQGQRFQVGDLVQFAFCSNRNGMHNRFVIISKMPSITFL